MFNPDKITPLELEFIRTYVTAMKREYALLYSVLDLMDPRNLAVRDVVSAAKMARELQFMHAEFDQSLHALSSKHSFSHKKTPASPTTDELADLFTLSFFKVISATPNGKQDDGWFSGEPGAMKKLFAALHNIEKQKLPSIISPFLSAAFKLFANQSKKYPLTDYPPVPWQLNLPPQLFTFKGNFSPADEDDEEYDEDEDDYYSQFDDED